MNGSLSTDVGSAESAKSSELTVDEKLDKIMAAVVFQQQLLITVLNAMDKMLQNKESRIIKPNGS